MIKHIIDDTMVTYLSRTVSIQRVLESVNSKAVRSYMNIAQSIYTNKMIREYLLIPIVREILTDVSVITSLEAIRDVTRSMIVMLQDTLTKNYLHTHERQHIGAIITYLHCVYNQMISRTPYGKLYEQIYDRFCFDDSKINMMIYLQHINEFFPTNAVIFDN